MTSQANPTSVALLALGAERKPVFPEPPEPLNVRLRGVPRIPEGVHGLAATTPESQEVAF